MPGQLVNYERDINQTRAAVVALSKQVQELQGQLQKQGQAATVAGQQLAKAYGQGGSQLSPAARQMFDEIVSGHERTAARVSSIRERMAKSTVSMDERELAARRAFQEQYSRDLAAREQQNIQQFAAAAQAKESIEKRRAAIGEMFAQAKMGRVITEESEAMQRQNAILAQNAEGRVRLARAADAQRAAMGAATSGVVKGGDALASSRHLTYQLTAAAQDAAMGFQMMGFTAQGMSLAVRGASNNLGALFSTMSPVAAIAGTMGVMALPTLAQAFMGTSDEAGKLTNRVDAAGSALRRMQDRANAARDAVRELTTAQREFEEAMIPEPKAEEERKKREGAGQASWQFLAARPALSQRIEDAEIQREIEQGAGKQREAIDKEDRQLQMELHKHTKAKVEKARLAAARASADESTAAQMRHIAESEREVRERIARNMRDYSGATEAVLDQALESGKIDKTIAEILKRRAKLDQDKHELSNTEATLAAQALANLKERINRGEISGALEKKDADELGKVIKEREKLRKGLENQEKGRVRANEEHAEAQRRRQEDVERAKEPLIRERVAIEDRTTGRGRAMSSRERTRFKALDKQLSDIDRDFQMEQRESQREHQRRYPAQNILDRERHERMLGQVGATQAAASSLGVDPKLLGAMLAGLISAPRQDPQMSEQTNLLREMLGAMNAMATALRTGNAPMQDYARPTRPRNVPLNPIGTMP